MRIPGPEIVVEQPAASVLSDAGSRSFGDVFLNTPASLTFTVSMAMVSVPHTQVVTRHVFGDVTLFCMSQASDEDMHLVQAGFDLIRGSLDVSDAKTGNRQ